MGAIMNDRIARTLEKFEQGEATLSEMVQRMTGGVSDAEGNPIYEGLPAICKAWDVPYGRVMDWLVADVARYERYQRALEVQAHQLVSEVVAIADDPVNDVARDKLRVETRFRVAKHHASKVYGDKVDINHNVTPTFNVVIAAPAQPEMRVVSDVPQVLPVEPVSPTDSAVL